DVVRPYGEEGLVRIADDVDTFVAAADAAMREARDPRRLARVDEMLATMSWDRTWAAMEAVMREALARRGAAEASQV
ncbi:MAG TPA: glycosyltransferase family 1 protein, partial [Vicinamibacteria bacterium]